MHIIFRIQEGKYQDPQRRQLVGEFPYEARNTLFTELQVHNKDIHRALFQTLR